MATDSTNRREGGASAVSMELGHHLEKLGHSVEILFQDDVGTGRLFGNHFRGLDFATRVANHILRDPNRYDVVSLRVPTGCIYGWLRRLYPGKGCPPYVAELAALEERRAYVIRQETRKGRGWENSLKNRLWHRLYHVRRFRTSVRTADRVVCATREVWNYVQLVYGLPSGHVSYLPHAVDQRFIRPRDYSSFKSPKLLYVGTWLEQRGVRYIGESLSDLVCRLPGIRLTIAGCLLSREKILSSIPLSARECVDVIPFVPSSQMPDVYASHDIFLFPSFFEAVPLVLLEAMAAGMPVIAAETSGMVDAVRDGWNGLLVPPGCSESIVKAVLVLSRDTELRMRLGTNAQETARWFSWERMARVLESVLLRLVDENKAARQTA